MLHLIYQMQHLILFLTVEFMQVVVVEDQVVMLTQVVVDYVDQLHQIQIQV